MQKGCARLHTSMRLATNTSPFLSGGPMKQKVGMAWLRKLKRKRVKSLEPRIKTDDAAAGMLCRAADRGLKSA
jgi:hypothetical protein